MGPRLQLFRWWSSPDVGYKLLDTPSTGSAIGAIGLVLNSALPRHRATPNLCYVNDSIPPCADAACRQPALCPLNRVRAGTAVRIKQLVAAPEVSHRLREMGFGEEQQVRVVSQTVNVICQVCQARLGLSQQLAEAILVEPLPPGRPLQVA